MSKSPASILKSLWSRLPDGRWAVTDLKGLDLEPNLDFGPDYFTIRSNLELMTHSPSKNIHEALASFGSTEFLLKQSIVPVVAWEDGGQFIRSIGTASVISCTGYVLTAAHVLMDPFEGGYGARRVGDELKFDDTVQLGALIPTSSAYGAKGSRFFPFEKMWIWGTWKESPLLHEPDRFAYLTDVAICKIPEMPHAAAHQPLGLSLNPFVPGEVAYAIGYAEMQDIPIEFKSGVMHVKDFRADLFVSIGEVMALFPENHLRNDVPTPGPCFDFKTKIPGKMSGAPIFGAKGAVVRGVVSRSWSGDRHAYGAMLGPSTQLPLNDLGTTGRTLHTLIAQGNEGMAQIQGLGL